MQPFDYNIWSSFEQKEFHVKIRDLDHLHDRLESCWEEFPQGGIDADIDQFLTTTKTMTG